MKVGLVASTVFACLIGLPVASFAGLAPDVDSDGIPDVLDKCTLDSRNASFTCDQDVDGYGNTCDGDFDQSGTTNTTDFSTYFIPSFKSGTATSRGTDMDCSGAVNTTDFSTFFIPKFKGTAPGGAAPGPSGLTCRGQPNCT
jgi:hypothetical protein